MVLMRFESQKLSTKCMHFYNSKVMFLTKEFFINLERSIMVSDKLFHHVQIAQIPNQIGLNFQDMKIFSNILVVHKLKDSNCIHASIFFGSSLLNALLINIREVRSCFNEGVFNLVFDFGAAL